MHHVSMEAVLTALDFIYNTVRHLKHHRLLTLFLHHAALTSACCRHVGLHISFFQILLINLTLASRKSRSVKPLNKSVSTQVSRGLNRKLDLL